MNRTYRRAQSWISLLALLALTFLAGRIHASPSPGAKGAAPAASRPTVEEAQAYVLLVNAELKRLWTRASTADWIRSTYITEDSEQNAAWANEAVMAFLSSAIPESTRFLGLPLDFDTKRMLHLLRLAATLPAPKDPMKRAELASLSAKLEGIYGRGKWCGKLGKECKDLQDIEAILAKSTRYDELLDAWRGWHSISVGMRPLYERLVALANEGAREIGFPDVGALWKSNYDLSPEELEKETDRLWEQVKPLYQDLHCYVRARIAAMYGKDKVPENGPIPAHLLGNMWAQEWTNLYSRVEPYPGKAPLDVESALKAQNYDPHRMVKLGEAFFVSLGLSPLPKTFWERSLFVKPRDRDVVCHASAWDVSFSNDLRIKMCIRQTEENLVTIHHELGHVYYYNHYFNLPVLYQSGAHDGFHEAIGDAIALSITPGYLKKVGLLSRVPKDDKGAINVMMKRALDKVAFLPFGKLIDQWRWDVFSGRTPPSQFNASWWALKRKYQGIAPAIARSEADFDPGAKYHIPASVPYLRYFLATILQFQFHRALCEAAGYKGPLHECSVFGSKEAGAKLKAMLALGASKPWPEALFLLTGQKQMDATAILDYFAPLHAWLKEQNKGLSCGW